MIRSVMLDIKVTQGSYWKGAQISYFVYILLTIFLGGFGLDHLALRSPLTAILKFLSIVPLLGFWYFYDIAQALGEREYVEKFGIGVPFYGPTGIGAGMFSGTEGIPEAPKDIPGPWRYFAYALTTCVFLIFPINKFVLGDYMSGILHILFYILFPLTFVAIAWSFYDVFHVIFKTRTLFEQGVPHMVPASMLVGDYFRRDALGPFPPPPPLPPSWFQRLFTAWMEVPIAAGKTVSKTIDVGRDATVGAVDTGITATQSVVKGVGAVAEGVGNATKAVTSGVANVVVGEVKDKVHEAATVASEAIQTAKVASNAVAGTVAEGAKAAEGTAALLQKIPEIGEKVASEMADPNKIIEAAKKSSPQVPQAGGALALMSDMPSVSTSVLLFSVGLVAFSGYVFYTMRNTYKKPEKSDDPPRDPGTVRGSAKPSE
jgi:TM2 domain-containing membrane protein YozV